jgi:capsular polysaccharide transport system permease protein
MKLFWVFIEPAAQLAVLIVIFSLIGRAAAYGTSFALFLLTGIATLTLFTTSSNAVMAAVGALSSPRRLAQQGIFTAAMAAALFRLIVGVFTAIVLAIIVIAWQRLSGFPYDLFICAEAFLAVGLLGFGMGLMRGYWQLFMPMFERVYGIASRALLFISGVFYVPSFLPPAYREIVAWNPVLHGIDWLRTGVYEGYPELVLSRTYLVGLALSMSALGMALLWLNRRRILQ